MLALNQTFKVCNDHVTFTQECRDVVCRLVKNKLELSVCLIHLISFQETKASSSQQMALWK